MTPIRIPRDGLPPFYGWTTATRFPPYVYSTGPNASLVHKVRSVDLCWVEYEMNYLLRFPSPVRAVAHTMCAQQFQLNRAHTCAVPKPDAVRCGRCHGDAPTYGKGRGLIAQKRANRQKLGCVMEGS